MTELRPPSNPVRRVTLSDVQIMALLTASSDASDYPKAHPGLEEARERLQRALVSIVQREYGNG